MRQCKKALKEREALIHVDFSESYKNKQQDETQSTYFGQSSFSLFTATVYHLNSDRNLVKRPVAVVSESSSHLRIAALTCIDFVIKEVERHTDLTKIIMWSDGFAAQFRSRFVFKLLANYRRDLQLEWNYNEAHHGKGPMDGIGGTMKNVVFRQVKSGRVIINSDEEFSVAANKFVPSIATLFQKEKDLLCNQSPPIPATLQIHKFVRSSRAEGGKIIDFYFLSNGKEPCHSHIWKGNVVTWRETGVRTKKL